MNVVPMKMIMSQRLVRVLVDMPLAEVQPHASAHQQATHQEMAGERLTEGEDGQDSTHEWRGRKICAGPCRTKVP